jgi:RNA polymerase sigma factor (TIGR02999 family)
METPPAKPVTRLLQKWSEGDQEALNELMPLVYDELRQLARQRLRHERPGHTLQPTALVHEAYLKLVDQRRTRWQNRAHFFAVAAQLIRRILVDYARRHAASKRGGGAAALTLDAMLEPAVQREMSVVALDDTLTRLASLDARQARLVELRFFGGLDVEETAEVLGISSATVKREWRTAKAWLYRELRDPT